jgi:alkylhydroperoxidase/carboxymuconolactone decarboxylase family protein YurZ
MPVKINLKGANIQHTSGWAIRHNKLEKDYRKNAFRTCRMFVTCYKYRCSVLMESISMKTRNKILDYEFTEVLDVKTRELIRVACAVAVNCPD